MTGLYSAASVLPEVKRQQYLSAMGIQPWYDPELLKSVEERMTNAQMADSSQQMDMSNKVLVDSQASGTLLQGSQYPESQLLDSQASATNHSLQVPDVTQKPDITSLKSLSVTIDSCQRCELHTQRKQVIIGEGNESADLVIIVDTPVIDTQHENALLTLESKQMLQAMLNSIGLPLSSVFMTSLLKCRPLVPVTPQSSEMICCDDHLAVQINLINPGAILVLGESATQQLLSSQKALVDLRLRQHQYLNVPVVATYHPSELLSSPHIKRNVWADLLQIDKYLIKLSENYGSKS